jgi:hypothetical protein
VIPVIINGVTSVEGNKNIRHKVKRDVQQKPGYKIVIIGDSHARGCAGIMKQNLSDRYKTNGVVKPGATMNTLMVSGKSEIRELTDKDKIVFWGGANDVSTNNTQEGLKYIVNFVQTNEHTNIILVSVPHRYDLPDWSCVNSEVGTFNRELMKLNEAL